MPSRLLCGRYQMPPIHSRSSHLPQLERHQILYQKVVWKSWAPFDSGKFTYKSDKFSYFSKFSDKSYLYLLQFPSYLPFVKAVIDSETSIKASFYPTLRETMVKKTVAMLQDLSSREGCSLDDKLKYSFCWINFGDDLKMGCVERTDYQMLLVPLLRFHSSKSLLEDEVISLDRYVESMPQNQKRVYYLAVKSIEIAKVSPFLATHIEVYFLFNSLCLFLITSCDTVLANFVYVYWQVLILDGIHDKLLVQRLVAYKGYQFSDITKEDLREFTEGLSPATFGITDSLRVFVDGLTLATFQAIPEQGMVVAAYCLLFFISHWVSAMFTDRWIGSFWPENNCKRSLGVAGGTCHSCSWLNHGMQCT